LKKKCHIVVVNQLITQNVNYYYCVQYKKKLKEDRRKEKKKTSFIYY